MRVTPKELFEELIHDLGTGEDYFRLQVSPHPSERGACLVRELPNGRSWEVTENPQKKMEEQKPHQNVGKLGDSGLKSRQIGAHVAMMGALAAESGYPSPEDKNILHLQRFGAAYGKSIDPEFEAEMLRKAKMSDPTKFTSSDSTVNKPTVQARAVWATGGRARRKKGKAARKARKANRRKKC